MDDNIITGRLALYTTFYPGAEEYFREWYGSVKIQTDKGFDIWIGVDCMLPESIHRAVGESIEANWVPAVKGDTPARIRRRAMEQIARDCYPAVVFVDSDDLLNPNRIEAARKGLAGCDVYGCAMNLISEDGNDLGMVFRPAGNAGPDQILPQYNVMGLSNTAWRTDILRECIHFPADCVLVDWYMVSHAWGLGARLWFDNACLMKYRQHDSNVAQILPPFTMEYIIQATDHVLEHFNLVLNTGSSLLPERLSRMEKASDRFKVFKTSVVDKQHVLKRYVDELNKLPVDFVWWSCVAHPKLETLWKC